jgi:alpha-aminoadipate carrier protein LysW
VDEEDVEEGDVISCDECGAELEVVSTHPLELEAVEEEEGSEDGEEDLEM